MISSGKIPLGKPDAHGPYQVSRTWCAYVTVEVVPGRMQLTTYAPWSELDLQHDQLLDAARCAERMASVARVDTFTVTLVKNTKAHGRMVDKVRHFYRAHDGKWRYV